MRQALSFALAIAFPLVAAAEPLKQEPPVPLLDRHYQWIVSVDLERGDPNFCVSADPRKVEIKDGVLRGENINTGAIWTLKLQKLNPDGSGRVVALNSKTNGENLFDFSVGHGPRLIHQTAYDGACVWVWTPLSAEAAASVLAQSNGPFDGKWLAQTNRCFPAGSGYRIGVDLQIKASKFSLGSTAADGTVRTCVIKIQPDGTFSNKTCDLVVSGQIKGSIMELHNTIPGGSGFCDKTYKRDPK
jgi:hypothetical protein